MKMSPYPDDFRVQLTGEILYSLNKIHIVKLRLFGFKTGIH
jgi:hypothetical protein